MSEFYLLFFNQKEGRHVLMREEEYVAPHSHMIQVKRVFAGSWIEAKKECEFELTQTQEAILENRE